MFLRKNMQTRISTEQNSEQFMHKLQTTSGRSKEAGVRAISVAFM